MPKRVLIVDDAVFMRSMIRDIFSSGGYEVVGEAAHGIEAIEKYRALKPDLTTMDIVMPYKSGIEATREIVRGDPKDAQAGQDQIHSIRGHCHCRPQGLENEIHERHGQAAVDRRRPRRHRLGAVRL